MLKSNSGKYKGYYFENSSFQIISQMSGKFNFIFLLGRKYL